MLLIQAYAAYTGSIVTATPGYSLYELCAGRLGARVERVPLIDWRHDLGAMATADVDVAFICNPHNPTGTVVRPEDLLSFIGESAARMIVIDEAYVDFAAEAGLDTVAEAVREPRVVVLRTFSKAHALAGVRVGYLSRTATSHRPSRGSACRSRSTLSLRSPRRTPSLITPRPRTPSARSFIVDSASRRCFGVMDWSSSPRRRTSSWS